MILTSLLSAEAAEASVLLALQRPLVGNAFPCKRDHAYGL